MKKPLRLLVTLPAVRVYLKLALVLTVPLLWSVMYVGLRVLVSTTPPKVMLRCPASRSSV